MEGFDKLYFIFIFYFFAATPGFTLFASFPWIKNKAKNNNKNNNQPPSLQQQQQTNKQTEGVVGERGGGGRGGSSSSHFKAVFSAGSTFNVFFGCFYIFEEK